MSLTEAMQEAYAVQPAGEAVLDTIELDHSAFAEPVRIVTGVTDPLDLPLESGGDPVTFTPLQVNVTPPGMSDDGPTPMRVRIDNVSSLMLPYLRAAVQSTLPITVTYRGYTTADLTQPGEVIGGLELRDVTLTATSAEGIVGFREIETQAFPQATYDETLYPALQNA